GGEHEPAREGGHEPDRAWPSAFHERRGVPDVKDLRQALLSTFQVEHQEHVQRIRESLRAFEQLDREAAGAEFDDVFRRPHSLKGGAGVVDLGPIEHLAHRLETLFSRIRTGQMRLDRPVVKVIDQVLDASEDWLASALGGGKTVSTEPALAAINALVGDSTD